MMICGIVDDPDAQDRIYTEDGISHEYTRDVIL